MMAAYESNQPAPGWMHTLDMLEECYHRPMTSMKPLLRLEQFVSCAAQTVQQSLDLCCNMLGRPYLVPQALRLLIQVPEPLLFCCFQWSQLPLALLQPGLVLVLCPLPVL